MAIVLLEESDAEFSVGKTLKGLGNAVGRGGLMP